MNPASAAGPLPGLISLPRITTLAASLVVALSAGTNYVYSAYAPQLGARLHISHTQLNIIGLAGNVGVYSSGPIWGRIVDSRGPRFLLASAFILLLLGYSGIRRVYDVGLPLSASDSDSGPQLSALRFYALVACSFITGAGGNGGLTGAINSTAKTFPDRARATTTGIVLSGFGLSAFTFSTIAHLAFAGDTSAFLLLLSLGTAFPMIVGFFFVRPVAYELGSEREVGYTLEGGDGGYGGESGYGEVNSEDAVEASVIFNHDNNSHSPLLGTGVDDPVQVLHHTHHHAHPTIPSEYVPPESRGALELSPARSLSASRGSHRRRAVKADALDLSNTNISGRRLWTHPDFWLLFVILSLLSGTGLMYINNVGSMSQALYAHDFPDPGVYDFSDPGVYVYDEVQASRYDEVQASRYDAVQASRYDEVQASRWQAEQVSTISIFNFSGRIVIGLLSDHLKNHLHLPRTYCLTLTSLLFLLSQLLASRITDVSRLWGASAVLGLAHGSMFGLFPSVCIEWFGMPHFSENWGFLSLSPMFGGNLFSVAFGRNLDAHEPGPQKLFASPSPSSPSPSSPSFLSSPPSSLLSSSSPPPPSSNSPSSPLERQCMQGLQCYVDTLHLTIAACGAALLLSVWAGWRDRRRIQAAGRGGVEGADDVSDEEDEE